MKNRKYLIPIALCAVCSIVYARRPEKAFPPDSAAHGTILQHIGENKLFVWSGDQTLVPGGWGRDRFGNPVRANTTKKIKGCIVGEIVLELPADHPALQQEDRSFVEIPNLIQDGVIEITYNKTSKSGTDVVRNTFRKFILASQPATPTKIEQAQRQLEELNTQVKALAEAVTVVQSKPQAEISITDTLATIATQLKAISEQLAKLQKEISDKPS